MPKKSIKKKPAKAKIKAKRVVKKIVAKRVAKRSSDVAVIRLGDTVKFKFKSRSGIVAGTGKVVKLPPKNPGPGENRLTVKYVRKIVKLAPQAVNQEVLISPYTSQCKLVSR